MDWISTFNRLSAMADGDHSESPSLNEGCGHQDVVEDNDHTICVDCGEVVGRMLVTQQFVYVNTRRKPIQCTVYNDIPPEFDPAVKNMAVNIYNSVTSQRIFRCVLRRSILAACIHRASVILNAPMSFDAFDLSTTDANRGIVFVAVNLAPGEYTIPFMSDDRDIAQISEPHGIDHTLVLKLYSAIKNDCEMLVAASQRMSILYSCLWTVISATNDDGPSLAEFVALITSRSKSKRLMSVATIEKKHSDIYRYILSRTMKKIVTRCLGYLTTAPVLRSNTSKIPVTLSGLPDDMRIVADDGFVYPIEDVDDVMDWNVVFRMKFDRDFHIPLSIVTKRKQTVVSFEQCPEPLRAVGSSIVRDEIRKFICA